MTEATPALPSPPSPFAGSDWFDPLEEAVRSRVRSFIEQLLEEELEVALGRGRYERGARSNGRRHGHRPRQLVTTFGPLSLSVPRAHLHHETGEQEWKSALLPAYKRLSRRAEALIAEAYLAGMNTRRVRRALAKLFEGRVGKDVVSRAFDWTGGRGVDHVVEVGGPGTLAQSITAVRIGGHISLIGVLTGLAGEVPTAVLMTKQARLQGLIVGNWRHQMDLVRAISAIGLRPVVDRSFALAEIASAFRYEEAGAHFGKICLEF